MVIAAGGLGTFLLRLSFIHLLAGRELSPALIRVLRYIPPATLAALILPWVLYTNGALDLSVGNHRLLALLLAALVGGYSRSVLLTLATGMGSLWLLAAVLP